MTVSANDVSLAIITFKRPKALEATLQTLQDDTENVRVILNGSTQSEYSSVISRYAGRVEFSQNLTNIGFAATANRAIIEANTRHVVISTDSCSYSLNWKKQLVETLNQDAPLQVSMSDPRRFAVTCIDKQLVALQGFYDHNFTQVYYEDEDWLLRSIERLGLRDQHVDLSDVMAVSPLVETRPSSKKSWNSVPNRLYFWNKWRRVSQDTPGYLGLRENIFVERVLPEPRFSYLEYVQKRYQQGEYSALPFVYDQPSPKQRLITRLTTNPVVTRSRYIISRLTNPGQELK